MDYWGYYRRPKPKCKVLLDFGTWEMTGREIIFGILLFAIYIIGGLCIYDKIDRAIEDHNMKYTAAVWVDNDETFKNRVYTDSRDAIVYGDWSSIGYVTFDSVKGPDKIDGRWSCVSVEKEHYTMHTRTVTYTVNGHTKTRTEHYYSWDHVWTDSNHVGQIRFAGLLFPYGTVEPQGIGVYLGTYRYGSDRYIYHAEKTEASGITFTHIEDGGISKCDLYTKYGNTPDDFQAFLESNLWGDGARWGFWIAFVILGLAGVVLFCYFDNDWLNNL